MRDMIRGEVTKWSKVTFWNWGDERETRKGKKKKKGQYSKSFVKVVVRQRRQQAADTAHRATTTTADWVPRPFHQEVLSENGTDRVRHQSKI